MQGEGVDEIVDNELLASLNWLFSPPSGCPAPGKVLPVFVLKNHGDRIRIDNFESIHHDQQILKSNLIEADDDCFLVVGSILRCSLIGQMLKYVSMVTLILDIQRIS